MDEDKLQNAIDKSFGMTKAKEIVLSFIHSKPAINMKKHLFLSALMMSLLFVGCDKTAPGPLSLEILSDSLSLNPTGYAPLSAEYTVTTNISTAIRIRVKGKHGDASDVVQEFPEIAKVHRIPVLGLYADYLNSIEVEFLDSTLVDAGKQIYSLQTDPLPDDYPLIDISANSAPKAAGMTFVSYFGHNSTLTPQRPFIFDHFGDIRWAVNFKTHPDLNDFFYDNGMERLQNGNLFFGEARTDKIYEINMLGEVVRTYAMPGFSFHHHALEIPNGNFVVSVTKKDISTVEDFLIEIDRNSGQIITEWDLRESLDQHRTTLTTDSVDWIHVNGLAYDPSDQTIIISGRTQGVIKVDWNNEVKWILAPHAGWETNGRGQQLSNFLLTPQGEFGGDITDPAVLNGQTTDQHFDWSWYQHAPKVLPNGNVLLFDNGFNRLFGQSSDYSRAVIYEIDGEEMTVRQDWDYGRDRGIEAYSFIVSDADFHSDANTVIMSPGAIQSSTKAHGKVIEIDYTTGDVVFEAKLTPPIAGLQLVTFHRTQRMSLYP